MDTIEHLRLARISALAPTQPVLTNSTPTARDFATEPLGQRATDIRPPPYSGYHASPPPYEHPPSQSAPQQLVVNATVTVDPRIYLRVEYVQLSPLEVALLRQGADVPVYVLVRPSRQRAGVAGTLRWFLELPMQHLCTRQVRVRSEDVGEDGRWAGRERS